MSALRVDGFARYPVRPPAGRRPAPHRGLGRRQPLYARVLRLRTIRPGGLLCFLFFEGMILLGGLLALAELTSWWAVPVLPVTVAAMVKLNDLVSLPSRPAPVRPVADGPSAVWNCPTAVLPMRPARAALQPAAPVNQPAPAASERGRRNAYLPAQVPVASASRGATSVPTGQAAVRRQAAGKNQRRFDRRAR